MTYLQIYISFVFLTRNTKVCETNEYYRSDVLDPKNVSLFDDVSSTSKKCTFVTKNARLFKKKCDFLKTCIFALPLLLDAKGTVETNQNVSARFVHTRGCKLALTAENCGIKFHIKLRYFFRCSEHKTVRSKEKALYDLRFEHKCVKSQNVKYFQISGYVGHLLYLCETFGL